MIELRWHQQTITINPDTEFESLYEDTTLQYREVCQDGRVIRDWTNVPVVRETNEMESTYD